MALYQSNIQYKCIYSMRSIAEHLNSRMQDGGNIILRSAGILNAHTTLATLADFAKSPNESFMSNNRLL